MSQLHTKRYTDCRPPVTQLPKGTPSATSSTVLFFSTSVPYRYDGPACWSVWFTIGISISIPTTPASAPLSIRGWNVGASARGSDVDPPTMMFPAAHPPEGAPHGMWLSFPVVGAFCLANPNCLAPLLSGSATQTDPGTVPSGLFSGNRLRGCVVGIGYVVGTLCASRTRIRSVSVSPRLPWLTTSTLAEWRHCLP